jgi:hypothetical protein
MLRLFLRISCHIVLGDSAFRTLIFPIGNDIIEAMLLRGVSGIMLNIRALLASLFLHSLPQPKSYLGCIGIDIPNVYNLRVSLLDIEMIDAHRIRPDSPRTIRESESS